MPARIGAVRALAANGGTGGGLALRLKALTGDREPEVIAECFGGLLGSHTESSVDFVARYVGAENAELAEAAVLALGACRNLKAVVVLKEKWKVTPRGRLKSALLLALASSRSEEALIFLLQELEEGGLAVGERDSFRVGCATPVGQHPTNNRGRSPAEGRACVTGAKQIVVRCARLAIRRVSHLSCIDLRNHRRCGTQFWDRIIVRSQS